MRKCMIVVPCYNEANRIDVHTFARFAQQHRNIRFVMVNDGSTDDTVSVLQQLAKTNSRAFEVLDLPQNCGKAEAVRRGMLQALDGGADFAGYWDADLATPLEEILAFLAVLANEPAAKLVIGSRVRLLGHQIDRHPVRHLLSRLFATAAALVLGWPIYDTQCGAKLFRVGPNVRRLFGLPFRTGWVFDVELLARWDCLERAGGFAAAAGAREIPLRVWKDVSGSKVGPAAFVRSFFELARIAWMYRRRATGAGQPVETRALPVQWTAPRTVRADHLPASDVLPRKTA